MRKLACTVRVERCAVTYSDFQKLTSVNCGVGRWGVASATSA
uniref:Uncharacterized protein n=1 Tax=Siphoviridae sp. ctWlk2 TaxID=2825539 RepID=A0A8S5U6S5_9CAUD|nr:MAG TPA: hypothetical protein [Siphoviridae sp. ctWlk2]